MVFLSIGIEWKLEDPQSRNRENATATQGSGVDDLWIVCYVGIYVYCTVFTNIRDDVCFWYR